MIKVNKIILDGDANEFGIYAGYCKIAGSYVLRRPYRGPYMYNEYYSLADGKMRLIGANCKRSYDINLRIPEDLATYGNEDDINNSIFLYEDGIFYLHLVIHDKHYAAVPRLEIISNGIREYPYRKLPDVKLLTAVHDGKEIPVGWVKEVSLQ